MKTIKKISALLLAVLLLAALGMSAAAAEAFVYKPVNGDATSFTFTKFLVLDKDANVPNAEFEFAIAAGQAADADPGTSLAILPGPDADKVVLGKASFGPESYDAAAATDIDVANKYDAQTQKYVKKTVTADFSKVSFPEPGVYRYLLTEVAPTASGFTGDSEPRVLDVYVSDVDGALEVTAYILHEKDEAITVTADYGSQGGELKDKNDGFTNVYTSFDLTISKEVKGNQASKDKFFKFTVTIEDTPGNVLTVDLSNAVETVPSTPGTNPEYVGKTNPATLTVGEDGKVQAEFYLQHSQSVTIKGLTKDAPYEVVETPEDYRPNNPQNAKGTITADTTVAFVNTRDGVIPTGVMLTVVPGVVIVTLAIAGLFLLGRRKKTQA